MTLQAYIDDSQGDDSGIYVLAGYVSSAEKWAAFSREWEELLPWSVLQPDGRYRFKMSEMAKYNRMDNLVAFYATIASHAEIGIACILDRKAQERVLDRITAAIAYPGRDAATLDLEYFKRPWRDPFYLSFRMMMDSFHVARVQQPELVPLDEVVDFYFDDTHQKKHIHAIWEDYLAERPQEFRSAYGREPRFENDEEFLPLQAADFLAWWQREWAEEYGVANTEKGSYPFKREKSVWTVTLSPSEEELTTVIRSAVITGVEKYVRLGGQFFPNVEGR